MMDRTERKPILEPIMLILKQRTGVATIIGIILVLVLKLLDFPDDIISSIVALIFVYVGGQKWVDAKEAGIATIEVIEEYDDVIDTARDTITGKPK